MQVPNMESRNQRPVSSRKSSNYGSGGLEIEQAESNHKGPPGTGTTGTFRSHSAMNPILVGTEQYSSIWGACHCETIDVMDRVPPSASQRGRDHHTSAIFPFHVFRIIDYRRDLAGRIQWTTIIVFGVLY